MTLLHDEVAFKRLLLERNPAIFFSIIIFHSLFLFQLLISSFRRPFSGPFQVFFQLIQLDVPTSTKRTASGRKWPYLVGMNIHLF